MVAEGNAGYLRAVLHLLQQHRRIHVVRSAGSAAEAAALIEQHRPHLALIGIKLPDRGGLEFVRSIKPRFADMKVALIAAEDDEEYRAEAMTANRIAVQLT